MLFLFLHLLQYVKGWLKNWWSIWIFQTLNHVMIRPAMSAETYPNLLSKSSFLGFHLAPGTFQNKTSKACPKTFNLTRWLKNELKIRRNAKSIIFLHVVDGFGRPISDQTHFSSTAWRGVNEHNWQCSGLRCFTRADFFQPKHGSFKGRHSSSKSPLETHEL